MPLTAIIVWILILAAFGFVFVQKLQGKKKYEGAEFEYDPDWLENSIAAYPNEADAKYCFFHFDKEYMHQGHIVEDERHNTVYEIKVLYNNGLQADETDFVNHIIGRTHHHKIGKTVTLGADSDRVGMDVYSSFKFDGEDVFEFLREKGYNYRFRIHGLAYHVDILKNGAVIGKVISSNNGRNLYERQGEEVADKAGGKGLYVLKCAYEDLDAVILYALAFTKTEFDLTQMTN